MATKELKVVDIAKMKASEGERLELWDSKQAGLHVRISYDKRRRRQNKIFYFRYRSERNQRRLKIGAFTTTSVYGDTFCADEIEPGTAQLTLSEARQVCGVQRGLVASQKDPAAEKKAKRQALVTADYGSFGDLANQYIKRYAKPKKRASSVKEDQRQIDADLIPEWGSRPANEITKQDVIRLLDKIVDRGSPVQANRTRALLTKIFNFGIQRELVDSNPALGTLKPTLETPRTRVLDDDEIKRMWKALEGFDPIIAATFKLKLLTAARDREVRNMRWDDIEGGVWTIPAAITKNKREHRVPLSPQVIALLDELGPLTGESEWVLASPSPRANWGHVGKLNKALERLRKSAKLEDVTGHDLRRSCATGMAKLGVKPHVIGRVLNHRDTSVTAQVYDQYSYDDEKQRALDRWGQHVKEVVTGKRDTFKVVKFKR